LRGVHNTVSENYTISSATLPAPVSPAYSPEVDDTASNNTPLSNPSRGKLVASFTPQLLVWSSHEQKGAERTAATLASYVKSLGGSPAEENALLQRLAFTLSNKRSKFPWKSFAIASNLQEAGDAFEQPRKPERAAELPVVAFVFTGQGAQWFAMGRELLQYELFRETMELAASYFKSLGCAWDLIGK
jgi:acyl transferase domain-containing protein